MRVPTSGLFVLNSPQPTKSGTRRSPVADLEHRFEIATAEVSALCLTPASDNAELYAAHCGCMSVMGELYRLTGVWSALRSMAAHQDDQLGSVVCSIFALKLRESFFSTRANTVGAHVCELVSKVDVFCELVTSAGNTVNGERYRCTGASYSG